VESTEVAKAVIDAPASANPIPGALYYYSPNAQRKLSWHDPLNNAPYPEWWFPENKIKPRSGAPGADFEFYREPNSQQMPEVEKRRQERKDWRNMIKHLAEVKNVNTA